MLKMKTDYRLKDYDFFLMICVLVLSGIGVFLIGSASQLYQIRQIAGTGLGVFVMAVVSVIDYKLLSRCGWGIYASAPVLLLSVTIAGAISGGAARWIEIEPLRFQPSEVSKILLIVFFLAVWQPEISVPPHHGLAVAPGMGAGFLSAEKFCHGNRFRRLMGKRS